MRLTFSILLLVVVVTNAAPVPRDARKDRTQALEDKLVGAWEGGPCIGSFKFNADGTYERLNYSPDGVDMSGGWSVKWDALPPTLVLSCSASNEQERIGKALEVKIVQLDDEAFGYQFAEGDEAHYKRVKK